MAQASGGKANQPSTAKAGSSTPEVRDDPETARAANPDTPAVTPGSFTGAVSPKAPDLPKPFLSEGMRNDLETNGWAVDPVSGARYEVDRDSGDVYVTERVSPAQQAQEVAEEPKGRRHKVDVKVQVSPTFTDPKTGVETVEDPNTGETRVTQPGSGVTVVTDKDGETRTIDDPRT
jgi:hypothetical protein